MKKLFQFILCGMATSGFMLMLGCASQQPASTTTTTTTEETTLQQPAH